MDQLKQIKPDFIIATLLALLPTFGSLAFETYISFNPGEDFPLSLLQMALFIGWIVLFIFALPFAFWKKKGKYMLYWPVSMLLLWLSTLFLRAFPIPDYIHFRVELPDMRPLLKNLHYASMCFLGVGPALSAQ